MPCKGAHRGPVGAPPGLRLPPGYQRHLHQLCPVGAAVQGRSLRSLRRPAGGRCRADCGRGAVRQRQRRRCAGGGRQPHSLWLAALGGGSSSGRRRRRAQGLGAGRRAAGWRQLHGFLYPQHRRPCAHRWHPTGGSQVGSMCRRHTMPSLPQLQWLPASGSGARRHLLTGRQRLTPPVFIPALALQRHPAARRHAAHLHPPPWPQRQRGRGAWHLCAAASIRAGQGGRGSLRPVQVGGVLRNCGRCMRAHDCTVGQQEQRTTLPTTSRLCLRPQAGVG